MYMISNITVLFIINCVVKQQESHRKGRLCKFAAFSGAGGLDSRESPSGEGFTSGSEPSRPAPV